MKLLPTPNYISTNRPACWNSTSHNFFRIFILDLFPSNLHFFHTFTAFHRFSLNSVIWVTSLWPDFKIPTKDFTFMKKCYWLNDKTYTTRQPDIAKQKPFKKKIHNETFLFFLIFHFWLFQSLTFYVFRIL